MVEALFQRHVAGAEVGWALSRPGVIAAGGQDADQALRGSRAAERAVDGWWMRWWRAMTRLYLSAPITALAGRDGGEAEAVAGVPRRVGGRRRATGLRDGLCYSVFGGAQLVKQGLDDPP